jgi:anti-sigma factor RsiW
MMTPESVHRDVGAYALGVLDPRDSARFEEHLAMCHSCPRELEQLSPVATLLSHVDMDSLVFAERSARDPRRADALVTTMRTERRRTRMRRRLTLAACLALLLGAGGLVASGRIDVLRLPGSPPAATSAAPKLHAVSQTTGTDATVQVDPKKWGSEITLRIARVSGPVTCRLVAVSRDGRTETLMGWNVPPEGYGTSAQPRPLILHGSTAIARTDLSKLEVRTTSGALLVSVPT